MQTLSYSFIVHCQRSVFLALAVVLAVTLLSTAPRAQAVVAQQPQKLEELRRLLADPEIQQWINAQKPGQLANPPEAGTSAVVEQRAAFEAALERIHRHLTDLVVALPGFPAELAKVIATVRAELAGYGLFRVFILFIVFVAAGLLVQWLFWRWTSGLRSWVAQAKLETVQDRLITVAARLIYSAGSVMAFAVGSVGAFLAFDWPERLRHILLGYLLAVLIYRSARVVLEFILSPPDLKGFGDAARFRVLPVSDASAAFWVRRFSLAIGWFAFGWVTVNLLTSFGISMPSRQLVAYTLGIVLLAIGIEAVWHRPVTSLAAIVDAKPSRLGSRARNWLLSAFFVLLWLLWVEGAMRLFWLLVVIVGLPMAATALQRAVNNVFRPPGSAPGGSQIPGVFAAIVERGLRAALIIGAIALLANKLGIDFTAMAATDNSLTRFIRGMLSAIVILLIADFLWHVIKTLIESKIVDASKLGETGTEAARRRDRTRTLLPIARNVLMIVIAIVALLMALSSLGVEIGPLIAGAGIVGVAIGFGAQTVVKDIISGVFYLLDDAFRVGEYIQSGSYKGTVESFSLRSVKLRHQRGSIFTVPFSDLGAIQNMSRDWAIEKINLSITYDSDVDKARKIVKKIGLELAQDPEFASSTLQPLKMQGIDEFGESGMMLRMKIITRPGEQFTIKRRALMLIKQAFDENGIKLAVPTVQVSGDADAKAAAANLTRRKHKAAATAPAG